LAKRRLRKKEKDDRFGTIFAVVAGVLAIGVVALWFGMAL
jgi:hypothetical protein